MNGLLGDIIQQGIKSYGARYEESPSKTLSMKGKGYFGLLSNSNGGFSTEISATDDKGVSFPLLVPTLTEQEVNHLLAGGNPTEDIYKKAMLWADSRIEKNQGPFASPTELKIPVGLLESR